MKLLNKISSNAQQRFFLTGNPGARITMTLRYMATQNIWVMDLQQGTFIANGIAIVANPNLLRCFKNNIDFGIACRTINGLDPYFIDAFETGAASLYLLSAEEVLQVEAGVFE